MLPKKMYIDRQYINNPEVKSIQSRLNIPFEIIDDPGSIYKEISDSRNPVKKGKELLFLTENKGAFIKECPGTNTYNCCGYKILHIGTFCNMDCSYCILQEYFHPPLIQYFVNSDVMLSELDSLFLQKKINRVGTGEFTDSLIWEKWTDLSTSLVLKFSKQTNSILELKTKTTSIEKLKNLGHNNKTIISWSLNTEYVIKNEERDTTKLISRLKAAQKCESWGYKLAFHFDPLILYKDCEKDYKKVVEQIFNFVSSENIVYISLGSFRFIPGLKQIIKKRFTGSKIIYGEFITGLDGKMRYFKPLRIDLYKKILSFIQKKAPEILIYFCMEDDEVWEKTLGFIPQKETGLSKMLDHSVVKHCGLDKKFLE